MKYIQSFYQYPVTFSAIGKTIPAKNADGELRNIAEVTDTEYETLTKAEPFFRTLVDNKKYRVLDKLPESYKPPVALVNEAREESERLAKENAELRAKLAAKGGKQGKKSEKMTEQAGALNDDANPKNEDSRTDNEDLHTGISEAEQGETVSGAGKDEASDISEKTE